MLDLAEMGVALAERVVNGGWKSVTPGNLNMAGKGGSYPAPDPKVTLQYYTITMLTEKLAELKANNDRLAKCLSEAVVFWEEEFEYRSCVSACHPWKEALRQQAKERTNDS